MPPDPAAPCTGCPVDPPHLVLPHPASGPPPCRPPLYHLRPHHRPVLPAPALCWEWKWDCQGLAKSNICGRLAKFPPESWFWRVAPLQLSPVCRAGLTRVGSGISIPPHWGWRSWQGLNAHVEEVGGSQSPQVELDASPAPFHGCRVAVSCLSPVCPPVFRVPQEGGHLLRNVSPSRAESCPTYLGLRLPSQGTQGRVSQAVQRRRAK